ncbi:MAG: hypothetical protein SO119_04790 [Phascolarctobacterium sp.]|nr:hypothetical protein [Phascolarctobacterium sp.]
MKTLHQDNKMFILMALLVLLGMYFLEDSSSELAKNVYMAVEYLAAETPHV